MAERKRSYEFKPGQMVMPADVQAFKAIEMMVGGACFHPIMRVEEVEERPGETPIVTVLHPIDGESETVLRISGRLLDFPVVETQAMADWLKQLATA